MLDILSRLTIFDDVKDFVEHFLLCLLDELLCLVGHFVHNFLLSGPCPVLSKATGLSGDDNYVNNLVSRDGVAIKYAREDLPQVNPQLYNYLATINGKSSPKNIIPQSNGGVNIQNASKHMIK